MTDSLRRPSPSIPIAEEFRRFRSEVGDSELGLRDMRRSGSLELSIGSMPASDNPLRTPENFPIELERLEGPIRALEVPDLHGETRFRYFLDGTQKTLPIGRIGLAPVVVALSVAGILQRTPQGEASLLPGSLRQSQAWVFPLHTGSPELDRIREWLEGRDHTVIDPIAPDGILPDNYDALVQHYGRLIELSQRTSATLRAALETDLISFWAGEVSPTDEDAWLVVDGKLRQNVANAIGLVKSLQMQHLAGAEAVALFNLPEGHRTSAFRYVTRATATAERSEWDDGETPTENRTMWYQRFWDSSGLDARHALVRIEAPHEIDTPEEIDRIAGWLMTERLPRATADPRWPTLLYPIHYLEAILKRRLAALTAGWPS
ncbi:MAG: hypothetical protein QM753_03515 [Thermomicrobiales bacterium]